MKEFLSATKVDISNTLAANNAGYMHYKMEQYGEAAKWFEQTIGLDPNRAIAYANLGDTYLHLDRKSEAKKAFLKYLELSPTTKNADEIKAKLSFLD